MWDSTQNENIPMYQASTYRSNVLATLSKLLLSTLSTLSNIIYSIKIT